MTFSTSSTSEQISTALKHLELALDCLDRADEVEAPPYVQMAIDLLRDRSENDKVVRQQS